MSDGLCQAATEQDSKTKIVVEFQCADEMIDWRGIVKGRMSGREGRQTTLAGATQTLNARMIVGLCASRAGGGKPRELAFASFAQLTARVGPAMAAGTEAGYKPILYIP